MIIILYTFLSFFLLNCVPGNEVNPDSKPGPVVYDKSDITYWLTKTDQSVKLAKQTAILKFNTIANNNPNIVVDAAQTFQSIDGFGYTLTGGSAEVINQLDPAVKQQLLDELFGNSAQSIGISYLRISMGASDLNSAPFTYNDLPNGQADISQIQFSIAPDLVQLIPLLQEIIAINPSIKIMAVPWSAPSWMKSSYNTVGSN